MTITRRRLATTTAAAMLAASLVSGCSSLGGGDDGAPPHQQQPTPSGTGPYPEPESPSPAEAVPSGKPGEPKGGIPSPADVDESDATAVSKAALTALTIYDTALDTSRNDAGRRIAAAGWCTEAYAAELRAAVSRSGPGADWTAWAEHRAYTAPELKQTEEAGRPRDTSTTAYRQWTITLHPTGRDGWKGSAQPIVAYAELTRTAAGGPWRLNDVALQ